VSEALWTPRGDSGNPWYGHRWIDAGSAKSVPGLEGIAAQVERGLLPPETPVLYAYREMTGGYPPVVIAAPFDAATADACLSGDRATARDCLEELEEVYETFLADITAKQN
jgi:hypothetical protein